MSAQNGGQQNDSSNKQPNLSWSAPQTAPPKAAEPAPKPVTPAAKQPANTGNANSNAAKIAGWLAVGVVAGVVLAWGGSALMSKGGSTAPTNGADQTATATDTAATVSDSSLTVATPQKAGMSVAIEQASVSAPTWVAVYESQGGKPGNVLGAALFAAGQQSGTVDLLRSTMAGQSYFVTELSDNGDRKFSLKDDQPLLKDGQPTWVTFTAN